MNTIYSGFSNNQTTLITLWSYSFVFIGHSAVKSSHEGKYATVFSDNVPSSFISVPEDDECYDTILIEEPDSVELRVSRQKRSQSHSSSNKRRIEALKKLNWGSTINKQPMPDISVKRPFPSGDTKPGTTDHNATETSQSEKPTRRSTQKTKGSSVPVNVSNERKIDVQFLTIKVGIFKKILKCNEHSSKLLTPDILTCYLMFQNCLTFCWRSSVLKLQSF